MCAVVVGRVDNCGVKLTIQFSINSEIFHLLCGRCVGDIDYLTYICSRNLVHIGKVGEYYRSITIYIIMIFLVSYIIVGWSIRGVTKIKLVGTSLYDITKVK